MILSSVKKYLISSVDKAELNIEKELNSYATRSKNDLTSVAPVDSGDFKDLWKSEDASDGNTKSIIISNDAEYASAIEFGSTPGQKPWPSPGEKTVLFQGMIFSNQAPGGTIDKVFNEDKIDLFANKIANSIIRAF